MKRVNDWEFFADGTPAWRCTYLWYRPAQRGGRHQRKAAWVAQGVGHRLVDGDEIDGRKVFTVNKTVGESHPEAKRRAFIEASLWLDAVYGIKELMRAPSGGWGDAAFVAARIKEPSS